MWDSGLVPACLHVVSAFALGALTPWLFIAFCGVDGPGWPYTSRASLPIKAHHVLWILARHGPLSEVAVMYHLLRYAAPSHKHSLVPAVSSYYVSEHIKTVVAPLLAQLHDQRLVRQNGRVWAATMRPITTYFGFEQRTMSQTSIRS